MSRWLLFPSFTCRHILSDKTGTITENNLRVVALATPLHEFSLGNLQSTNAIDPSTDPCLSMLLLNMLTNHSALSIKNTVSSDLTEFMNSISHAQSQSLVDSLTKSSSFSELCITSLAENSSHDWIQPQEEDIQVFCSSQDERVVAYSLSHIGSSRCCSTFWIRVPSTWSDSCSIGSRDSWVVSDYWSVTVVSFHEWPKTDINYYSEKWGTMVVMQSIGGGAGSEIGCGFYCISFDYSRRREESDRWICQSM